MARTFFERSERVRQNVLEGMQTFEFQKERRRTLQKNGSKKPKILKKWKNKKVQK